VLFDDADVPQIATAIKQGMLPKTWGTRRQHVADLKERFDSTTACPKCGNPLALRTAKCQSASKFDHPTASNFDQGFMLISCAV
jgi:hypothetical protein